MIKLFFKIQKTIENCKWSTADIEKYGINASSVGDNVVGDFKKLEDLSHLRKV